MIPGLAYTASDNPALDIKRIALRLIGIAYSSAQRASGPQAWRDEDGRSAFMLMVRNVG